MEGILAGIVATQLLYIFGITWLQYKERKEIRLIGKADSIESYKTLELSEPNSEPDDTMNDLKPIEELTLDDLNR